ncbi:Snf7 family protein [bacterium]|nr:Snf7 family protein [bacterium]
MAKVQARLSDLEERARTHRTLALKDKQNGHTQDALRELRKAKSLDRQVETTRGALDALERQLDTLSDLGLQKELATALTSTSRSLKGKTKGMVELADGAVELTQELQDDAEDIQAAFEGLVPANGSSKIEDEDLLAEINEMMGLASVPEPHLHPSAKEAQPRVQKPLARKKQSGRAVSGSEDEMDASSFPVAPTGGISLAADSGGAIRKGNGKVRDEKTGLMASR